MLVKRESYNTYQSFVEGTKNERSKHAKSNNLNHSEREGAEFSGTETIQEARDLCLLGWNAGIQQMQLETTDTSGAGFNPVFDVTGETVDIGLYMTGQPECMLSFEERTPRELERLKIYVNLAYTASVNLEKALKFSVNLVKLVNKAQAKNDIEIIGIFATETSKNEDAVNAKSKQASKTIDFITLKPYGQTVVLNTIAAALHPSFFRRLWFRHQENSGQTFNSGYGTTVNIEEIHAHIVSNENGELYKDAYIMTPNLNDLNSAADITKEKIKTNLKEHRLKAIL